MLISETQPETEEIFIKKANESDSQICFADKNFSCNLIKTDMMPGERKYIMTELSANLKYEGTISLGGDYQSKNLQAVFASFDILKEVFDVSEKNISDGIRKVVLNTGLYGRWQILSTVPLTICDTGHNLEGLEYVVDQINRIPKSALHIILGFVNDKDLGSVLPLFPADALYYFTKASVPGLLMKWILNRKQKNTD